MEENFESTSGTMAELSGKKEQIEGEEKPADLLMEEKVKEDTSGSSDAQMRILSDPEEKLQTTSSTLQKNKDQEKQKNDTVAELIEGESMMDVNLSTCSIEESKISDSSENTTTKRSMSKDQLDKDTSNKSDTDSDEDSSKRQRLNENQPNTSTTNEPQNSEGCTSFRKLESKVKKRNYRSQSNSSDVGDDSCTQESADQSVPESIHEESGSESIEFPHLSDSSDERSEASISNDHGDSNEWTTASEDDMDEMRAVLQKEPSKPEWSIIKDVVNRQIGFNNFIPCRFYGSLHAVQRLELMFKLEEHVGCVNALGFNQKGNLLASASDDLTVTIWDWAIGKKHVSILSGHRGNVFQSKWLPLDVECFVVSCARDGQVRLIDIRTSVTRKLAQHRAACHKISTHLDLPHVILSAGEDSKVLSIDVRESKPTKLLMVRDNDQDVDLYSIHSNPLNNNEFCIAGRTHSVKIYDRRKPAFPIHQLCPKHLMSDELAHVTCAVYNCNGTEIIASYNNEDIYLFDVSTSYQKGDFAHRYQGHRNSATFKGVNFFGPNSEYILSGSDCGNIFIWDKKTEAIVQWMAGDEQGIVNALEPHPHIPILATSGLDYDVKIWIPSREKKPNIKQQLQSCVKKNLIARTKSIAEAESAFDGHVLWLMLRHIRQAERRRSLLFRRNNPNQNNISDDDTSVDLDDDNEDLHGDHNDNNSDSSSSLDESSESDNHSES